MKSVKNKFQHLEIVKIATNPRTVEHKINNTTGTILGFDYIDNEWIYSVDIEEQEALFSLNESDLIGTGKIDDISNFYDDPPAEMK